VRQTRQRTPRPLWCGLDYGPALVVLDAADTSPTDLPAGWESLAQRFQIAWCAVAEGGSLHAVEDVLESLGHTRTHLVARTTAAETVARVVAEFPDVVRTVVLVGPGRSPDAPGVRTVRLAGSDLADLADQAVPCAVAAAVDGPRPLPLAVAQ